MFKPDLNIKPYLVLKYLLWAAAVLTTIYILQVAIEINQEIKFNPDAVIEYEGKRYQIKRTHSNDLKDDNRGGYQYSVSRIDKYGNVLASRSYEGIREIYSCQSIRQDGQYLVFKHFEYCPEPSALYYLVPSFFHAGEVERVKLI